jgi:hypothetical protein
MDSEGDVVFLKIFNVPILLLNSFEATTELMERRSAVYSDRIQPAMMSDLQVLRPL